MKQLIILSGIIAIPLFVLSQDTIPRPGSYDEGYFFVGPDDVLKFKGYAQFDSYFPINNNPGVSEFIVRRARFAATGYFQKKFRYMLYARFDKGKAVLNEAFLESRHLSFAKLRVGQFKVPFSLSNLRSSSQIDFIGRSFIVDNFSPSYDIGAMLFGDDKFKHIDYAIGVFNGQGANNRENNNGKLIVGRLVVAPFISTTTTALSKLYFGNSIALGRQKKDFSQFNYSTTTDVPVFSFADSISQDGRTTVYGYDVEWYVKRFSAKAEYLNYKAKDLRKNNSGFNQLSNGYYIAATFLLTGEDKKRNEFIKPENEFDPKKGNWGAFELAARYEKAALSGASIAARVAKGTDGLTAFTGGINWYLNDDVKVVLNYSNFRFNQNIVVDQKPFSKSNNIMLRVQYQF